MPGSGALQNIMCDLGGLACQRQATPLQPLGNLDLMVVNVLAKLGVARLRMS